MAQITVDVCDKCMNPMRVANPWTIIAPGNRIKEFWLCDEHSQPLSELVGKMPKATPVKKATVKRPPAKKTAPAKRGRRTSTPIVTPEELERLKAQGRA